MLNLLRTVLVFTLAIGAAWLPRASRAQLPQPRLTSIAPLGVTAGGSVDLTVRGTDLEGVAALWFDHPGLRAFHLKGATFRVACAPGTPLGQHDLRAIGTFGVSNPRTFVVGDLPETGEVEPNNDPKQATSVALNSVINGEIGAADVDYFAFEGQPGQRVFLDLAAERVESRLDATIHVLDALGREIGEDRDTFGADPFLDLTLPAAGRYVVKVHDVVYNGSADHTYRLRLHNGPHLDAVVPAAARPGEPTTFTLIGRNIGGQSAPDLVVGGRPLERTQVTIAPPAASEPDAAHPWRGYWPASAAPRQGFEYALQGPSGTSNPVFIAETTDPVVIEREPNDPGHPQEVPLPCDISGSFGAPGDLDVYRFRVRKGDVWWIEASAEHLGSPADPFLVVQQVSGKGEVEDLTTGEDLPDRVGGPRFDSSSVDAAVRWQVPADGVYQVAVNDLYGSQRGDPRLVYRLHLRAERPDFRLVVIPQSGTALDSLTVRAGGRATADVLAWRLDGFSGPIRVEARDLPPGVRCEPVVIAAGQALAPLVFEAAEGARPHVARVRIIGRGRMGDRKDDLSYVAGATPLGPDVAHEALAGNLVWPPAAPAANQPPAPAPARMVRGLVLTVGEAAPFTLTVQPDRVVAAQGRLLHFDLSVTRRAGFTEAVTVVGSALPPGAANAASRRRRGAAAAPATAATIAKGASTGTADFFLPSDASPGIYTFLLRGTGPYPFHKDPKAKTKPNVNLDEPANPVTVTVRPAPVKLTVSTKGSTLKQGGRLEVTVTVDRQNGFGDGVTLALDAPPASKLSADPATVAIAPGQKTAKLAVKAAADSPPGAVEDLAVRATARVRGEAIEVDQILPLTINK